MPGDAGLRRLQQAAVLADGARRLLREVADRLDAHTALVDEYGAWQVCVPEWPRLPLPEITDGIARVTKGCGRFAAVDPAGGGKVHVVALADERPCPLFVVHEREAAHPAATALVADAARLLALRWRLDRAEHRARAISGADAKVREAVLHLLMNGDVAAARTVAGALGPPLPDPLEVHVVEGPAAAREDVARRCEEAWHGSAWIVRCPVYRRHLIVLAPAGRRDDRVLGALRGRLTVGVGEPVPARSTRTGYAQAFHALAAARQRPTRMARFSHEASLESVLGPSSARWAYEVLGPLLDYVPQRAQDPDAAELVATLRGWLEFSGGAARLLKVHRNTLRARLHRVSALVGRDTDRLAAQAELHLALRVWDLYQRRPRAAARVGLAEVLDSPAAGQWASMLLAPLVEERHRVLLATVRAWLAHDASVDAAAAALGISAPGVRKRLVRTERLMGRSLLAGPSARYDLFLALNVYDRR